MGKVFRLRPRFSLRAVLLAFVVLAAGLGWLAARVRQAQRQAVAVARLEELGGTVTYDFGHYFDENGDGCINPSRKPTDWLWLRDHFGNDIFSGVCHVRFGAIGFYDSAPGKVLVHDSWFVPTPLSEGADEEVSVLASLPGLHSLDLGESAVTNSAIPQLARLTSLRWLRLAKTDVTAKGVERLRKALPKCEVSWSPRRPQKADGSVR